MRLSVIPGFLYIGFLFAAQNADSSEKPHYFEYADLHIGLDDREIKLSFPNSRMQSDPFSNSTTVWVSSVDVKAGISQIQINRFGGLKELRLLMEDNSIFEKRENLTWEESHYLRYPLCDSILSTLTKIYGEPTKPEPRWVESICNQNYCWHINNETLTLGCYTLHGKGKSLADEISISRPEH